MLKDLLEQKYCFKLICGAGNENLQEVEKLVAVYAAAGCRFFDFAADEKVLTAAQKGLNFSIPEEEQKDYHFCISVGTNNDQHFKKAQINVEKCKRCEQCIKICPQNAINQHFKVVKKNCIGCLKCVQNCEHKAISVYSKSNLSNLSFLFSQSLVNCIELHASDSDEHEVDEIWEKLNRNFNGMLSLCLGRKNLSDEEILARVKRLVDRRKPYSTIIQADGIPMSGGKDDFETTRPAVETGALIQSLNLPVFLILSGGTNSKTAQLANELGVNINGIAVGSFARKIVKEFIEREDFFVNKEAFNQAVKIAKELVFMGCKMQSD